MMVNQFLETNLFPYSTKIHLGSEMVNKLVYLGIVRSRSRFDRKFSHWL